MDCRSFAAGASNPKNSSISLTAIPKATAGTFEFTPAMVMSKRPTTAEIPVHSKTVFCRWAGIRRLRINGVDADKKKKDNP
jgi:hypothetical protein